MLTLGITHPPGHQLPEPPVPLVRVVLDGARADTVELPRADALWVVVTGDDPGAPGRLAARLGRRVRYWQYLPDGPDPSGLAGFAAAAHAASPGSVVVGEGPDCDALDVRLPDDPREIPAVLAGKRVDGRRLVVGEFGGPRHDADPALADRIGLRELITRPLLAFAEGATVACWAGEPPGHTPVFALLAGALAGATGVRRLGVGGRPDVWALEIVFAPGSGRTVHVLWRESDPVAGDAEPREALEWHWVPEQLHVANAFAEPVPMPAWAHGRLAVPLSATPVLLSATPLATVG